MWQGARERVSCIGGWLNRKAIPVGLLACAWLFATASASAQDAKPLPPKAALPAPAQGYANRSDVHAFIDEMVARHGFAEADLKRWFTAARAQPRVVELMDRPVSDPPKWFEYSQPFLSQARVQAGVAFWNANAATLARAASETGVPAEVIVAILGVETFYGRHTGSHRVIDALATLAFDYPRRATFFKDELRDFLLLTREQKVSPLSVRGSFAGAIGLPQFIPSSYLRYAVDFDGNGRIDLAGSADDAIGSIANYFVRHDWQRDQPVLLQVALPDDSRDALVARIDRGLSERRSLDDWLAEGVTAQSGTALCTRPGLLMLEEGPDAQSYWLACPNFYAIMRYNRSRLYATAVWQLAQALRTARPS